MRRPARFWRGYSGSWGWRRRPGSGRRRAFPWPRLLSVFSGFRNMSCTGSTCTDAGIPYCRRRWIPWAICFASFWGRLAVPMPPGWLPPFLMAFMAFPASIPRCLIACPPTITAPCGLSWRAIMRRPRQRWRMNLPWRWRSPAWSVPPCCAARTRKMSFWKRGWMRGCCSVRIASSGVLPACWAVFTRDCSASVCLRILWNSVLAFQSLLKAFMSCPGWNTAA